MIQCTEQLQSPMHVTSLSSPQSWDRGSVTIHHMSSALSLNPHNGD
jgi:hypothetical protein